MNREAIYQALFALAQTAVGIDSAHSARQFITWDDLQPEQMPYLMQVEPNEVAEVNGRGIPIKWCFHPEILVYVGKQDGKAPGELINPLIDSIETAIGDPLLAPQTLGGLVSQVRIKGTVEKGQNKLGTINWFLVPLEIVVPA
jgi:hypothetical protein